MDLKVEKLQTKFNKSNSHLNLKNLDIKIKNNFLLNKIFKENIIKIESKSISKNKINLNKVFKEEIDDDDSLLKIERYCFSTLSLSRVLSHDMTNIINIIQKKNNLKYKESKKSQISISISDKSIKTIKETKDLQTQVNYEELCKKKEEEICKSLKENNMMNNSSDDSEKSDEKNLDHKINIKIQEDLLTKIKYFIISQIHEKIKDNEDIIKNIYVNDSDDNEDIIKNVYVKDSDDNSMDLETEDITDTMEKSNEEKMNYNNQLSISIQKENKIIRNLISNQINSSFHSKIIPYISIEKYINRLAKYSEKCIFVYAMVLIERFCDKTNFFILYNNIYR